MRTLTGGKRALDVGCGTGILLSMIKDHYEDVYGIDIAEFAVTLARRKNIQAEVVNLNVDLIPYADGFFDTVTILSAI